MRTRLHSWFVLGLALGAAGPASAAPASMRLIEAAGTGTRFEVVVPEAALVPADGSNGRAFRVSIDGWDESGAIGEAPLPARVFLVAVPPVGEVRVTAAATGARLLGSVPLAAMPFVARGKEAEAHTPALAASGAAPTERARLLDVSWMRHQRVARVGLYPADYSGGQLTTWSGIEVRVETGGAAVPRSGTGAPPDSDAFEPLYRETLVNYDQGRAWRSVAREAQGAALAVPDTSVFVGRHWLKISIPRPGFYRMRFAEFRRFAPFNDDTTTAVDSLRMFTWSGLPVLPENDYCDACGFKEVSLGIVDGGDGKLNQNDDAIYFYALGPSDWADRFDATQPDTVFMNDPYSTRNVYYLTFGTSSQPVGGPWKRIGTRSGAVSPGGGEITPTTFPARVHNELDITYAPDAWPGLSTYMWDKFMWAKVSEGSAFSASSDAPGADTTQVARLRARMWSLAVELCNTRIQTTSLRWNNVATGSYAWRDFTGYTIDTPVTPLRRATNNVQIIVNDLTCPNQIGISWLDLFYQRAFEPVFNALEFRSPPGGGSMLYRIAPFTLPSRPRLFDVTDALAPVEITDADYTGTGSSELAFESADDGSQRYFALSDTAMLHVAQNDLVAAAGTSLDNLRSHTQQANYVVIYYDEFQVAADSLAAWRRAYDGFRTKTVPISAIYDQFSGGRTDPTAMRNFLHAAYANWTTPPAYVTFFGDASYDFKNITGRALPGQPASPLPTYENGFEDQSKRQYTTDDWLLNVDNPNVVVPDFLGGRLPVTDATLAMSVVRDKVLRYDRSVPSGIYRGRVMLVADDNEQGSRDDPLHWEHVSQVTSLDTLFTPSELDRVYVYLHHYPDGAGDTKPAAKADIYANIEGTGITVFDYVGHGSPVKLSDESVFTDTDASTIVNPDKLPLFIAASCDVGHFSDPAFPSLGEKLVVRTGGGAIGVVSATDLAYSGQNAVLNKAIFASLFARPSGGKFSGEVAKALAAAKGGTPNNQKYQLMGDAALKLNLPELWVEVGLEDEVGADTTAMTQGHKMHFTGRLVDGRGGPPVALDGTADVLVEDSAPLLQTPQCTIGGISCTQYTYRYRAGPIYRGTVAVHGGTFAGDFIVPIEARPGSKARIRAYFSAPSRIDGTGSVPLSVKSGTSSLADDVGPEIRLSFPNGATRVRPDALLRIDITDPSGILLTGHTLQNGIIVTIDGNSTNRVDVTSEFNYAEGSYTTGSATFTLPGLAEGPHVISVSAADNLAAGLNAARHRTQVAIQFDVAQAPPLQLTSAYLFPNPTSSKGEYRGGRFVADMDGGPADILLRIYTPTGKLIRDIRAMAVDGQIQLPWDGLDAEGAGLANGTYLFKLQARAAGASGSGDDSQKSHREGRFVIVNP